MLQEGKDAGAAALMTGYESYSRFNREYKCQFGAPPHRDVPQNMPEGIFMGGFAGLFYDYMAEKPAGSFYG